MRPRAPSGRPEGLGSRGGLDAEYILRQRERGIMQASATALHAERAADARDWVAWYDELSSVERKEIRDRLLTAPYEDVKADPELRNFFFFHSEDVASELPPGAHRLVELHGVVQMLRGATDPELLEKRRKAVAFLLGEYQNFLRDNPWLV